MIQEGFSFKHQFNWILSCELGPPEVLSGSEVLSGPEVLSGSEAPSR